MLDAATLVGTTPSVGVDVAFAKKYATLLCDWSETNELGSTLLMVVAWLRRKLDRSAVGCGEKTTELCVASARCLSGYSPTLGGSLPLMPIENTE